MKDWYYAYEEMPMDKETKKRWVLFVQKCKKGTMIEGKKENNQYYSKQTMEELLALLCVFAPNRNIRLVKGETLRQYRNRYNCFGKYDGDIQIWNIQIEGFI